MSRKKKADIKYIAAPGAQFSENKAQIYGEHIKRLMDKNKGALTPQDVLDDAVKSTSPIHNIFQWDDTKAAHNYRIGQARNLINHLEVEVVYKGKLDRVKSFHSIKVLNDDKSVNVYTDLITVELRRDTKEILIEEAIEKIKHWKKRYGHLKELTGIIEAIEKAEARL